MESYMLKTSGPVPRSTRWGRGFVISIGTVLALCYAVTVHAEPSGTGLEVTVPNGYANINVNDIQRQSTAGTVTIKRRWDGQEWKFNPEWESLSQSWKNLTGSQTADTTASGTTSSGGEVTEVTAEVPDGELLRYAVQLRALTAGTGRFRRSYLRHEPVPGNVAPAAANA